MTPDDEFAKRARGRLGTVLKGKYRLDEVIGIGGMAVVYRATHRNRAQLAVKMLHAELSVNSDVRTRFLREGYAANSVNHPGAVLVVDDDVAEDGSAFLVMELLVGATAEAVLDANQRRLPVPAAVGIVHQLLDVLASAHAAGIVHRDVKPANLLVTRDGTVKVLDFGIARVLETALAGGQATGGGMPLGTPAFMAPEQAVARTADVDARTDVWAAGATLFTLLSGELVHDGPTPAQILVYSATRPARSLAEVAPAVPAEIVAVVDRALAFERADRWPSAEAMRDALADASRVALGALPSRDVLAALVPHAVSLVPSIRDEDFASAPTMDVGSLAPQRRGASTSSPVSSSRATAERSPKRRLSRLVASAFAAGLVLLAGIVFTLVRFGRTPASSVEVPRVGGPVLVAIFDFQNRTSDDIFAGTVELLLDQMLTRSDKLSPLEVGGMRPMALDIDLEGGVVDERIGPKLAARWKMRTVLVQGVVTSNRAGATLDVTVTDSATRARIGEFRESADGLDDVIPAVGRVVVALRTALGDPPADPADAVRSGMSASLSAIRDFSLGREASRMGRYEESLTYARRAIKTDPVFVEARVLVAVILGNLNRHTEAEKALAGVPDHLDGSSEYRRLSILSLYHGILGEYAEAAPEFAELVSRWPLESRHRLNLAEVYLLMGDVPHALETIRIATDESPTWVIPRADLARIELASGHFQAVSQEVSHIYKDFREPPPEIASYLALAEALQGHRDAAIAAYHRLEQVDAPSLATAEADLAMFEGRFDDAQQLLQERVSKDSSSHSEATAKAWATLAELRVMRNDLKGAADAAARVAATTDAETVYRAARALIRAGASRLASDDVRALEDHPGLHPRVFSALLAAHKLRAGGHLDDAIAKLKGILSLGDFWLTHAELAGIELEAGAFEDANRELELCLARTGEAATALGDTTPTLRYLPGVRYDLARAREGLHRADTKEAYEAFLAMEPSPQEDPRVSDVRRRLAGLH